MNFSRYINLLRFQEMERLRNDLTCAHLAREERLHGRLRQFPGIHEDEKTNEGGRENK